MANANMTAYLEGKLGNLVLNGIAYAGPTSGIVYVGLFSGTISEDSVTSGGVLQLEVSGQGYTRVGVQSGFIAQGGAGFFVNSGLITFPVASGSWNTISGVALFDASGVGAPSGNALLWGLLTTPKQVLQGDTATFASGQISVQWL